MARFSRVPPAAAESVNAFLAGADIVPMERPWEAYPKKGAAKHQFNLRLNDYQMGLLKHVAGLEEDVSIQRVIKRILIPELERRAK